MFYSWLWRRWTYVSEWDKHLLLGLLHKDNEEVMYCWVSEGRLRPWRMVYEKTNYHTPEYEMHRLYHAKKRLRKFLFPLQAATKFDKYLSWYKCNPGMKMTRKKKIAK